MSHDQTQTVSSAGASYSDIVNRLERLPITWIHRRIILILGLGWLFDSLDVGIITFIMVPIAKDWNIPSDQLGLIGSAGMAGMLVGAFIAGVIGDYWGRKKVFQVTLLIFSLASLMCAFSWSVTSLIIFRFFVGLGLGGELPVISSMVSEFIPSSHRGRYTVYLQIFWLSGWLLAAIIAFLIIPAYGWRIPFIIGALPAFYVWVIQQKLLESPRWLSNRGRFREAETVIKRLESETELRTGKPLLPAEKGAEIVSKKLTRFSFLELWTSDYRTRTIMLWVLWFGLVFGYYGIYVWLPTMLVKSGFSMVNSFLYVIIITIAQVPGFFSASFLVDRVGRKPVLTIYLILFAITAYLFGHSYTNAMIIFWACWMSFFELGAWGAVYTYTPEQYPTASRATGSGAAASFGRIGGIISPYLGGLFLSSLGREGVTTMNAAVLVMAAIAVYLLGTETKEKTIEETSQGG